MTSTPLLTFIVPVYNVEAYLRECLDSVLFQTSNNWECIVVDDCSSDTSADIIAEYTARDKRFRLITHTENRGLSGARNSAIAAATGEYITFLDGDDAISSHLLALFENIQPKADITLFDFIYGTKAKFPHNTNPEVTNHTPRQTIESMLYQRKAFNSSACGKIYSRRLFDNLKFTDTILYEDLDIMDRLVLIAESVSRINTQAYFYRCRPGSIIHTWSRRRLDVLDVTQRICSRLTDDNELHKAACDRRFAAAFNMLLLLRKNGMKKSADASRCRAILRSLAPSVLLNRKSRLKNRLGAALFLLIHIID